MKFKKLEGVDLKYSPKIHKYSIFGRKFRHFLNFQEIFEFDEFDGVDFKYDNTFSKILPKKHSNKLLLVIQIRI